MSQTFLTLRKQITQSFSRPPKEKLILFILGAQRFRTSLIQRIFENDLNTKIFKETSCLSSEDGRKIRLNPFPSVKQALKKVKAPFVILKPLVESQNALELLDYFENSKALWVYRDYRDVASAG